MTASLHRIMAAVAASTLTVGLLAAHPAVAADRAFAAVGDRTASGEHYVSLGDSLVAGPGILDARDQGCGRSKRNFPSLIAAQLRVASFTDASCSAAKTTHLRTEQVANGTTNPPQLDALGPETTLVTLGTIGGNDVDVPSLAGACILNGCADRPTDGYDRAVDDLAPVYRGLIAEVRLRAPRARIVAVGYGRFVPEESCAGLGDAGDDDLRYLQRVVDRISDTFARVAAEEGVAFADLRTLDQWADHSACAPADTQWIRGLDDHGDGFPLHPSSLGMTVLAAEVLQTVRSTAGSAPEPAPLPTRPAPPVTATGKTPAPSTPAVRPAPAPTSAQRVAAAVRTLQVRATCTGAGTRKRLTVRVSGGHGLATRAVFRAGRASVATDRRAPFAGTRKVSALRRPKARGPVRATVTVRHGRVVRTATVATSAPRCLR